MCHNLIENKDFPGFFIIPGFSKYSISKFGNVINNKNGKYLKGRRLPPDEERNRRGGYLSLTLTDDSGKTKYRYRHRLVCEVFKGNERTEEKNIVNHINGIPGDDYLENLEWCSYSENLAHALINGLNSGRATPIVAMNVDSGEELRFSSRKECSDWFPTIGATEIYKRIHEFPERIYTDKMVFKLDDGKPWPKLDKSKTFVNQKEKDVVIRDVFTGHLYIFDNCNEAAKFIGVKKNTPYKHATKLLSVPVKGYNIRFLKKNIEWPKHNERMLSIYRENDSSKSGGVVAKDNLNGKELFWPSVAKAAEFFGVSKEAIIQAVSKRSLYKGQYKLSYYYPRDYLKLSPS